MHSVTIKVVKCRKTFGVKSVATCSARTCATNTHFLGIIYRDLRTVHGAAERLTV